MKSRLIPVALVIGVAGAVVGLNLMPDRDSSTFEQRSFPEGFGPSRGWPFSAIAPASDEGFVLVRGSVVMGGTTVYHDRFNDSQYPHLAVNWDFVIADFVIAVILSVTPLLLNRLARCIVESHDAGP
ncbi:MAG TPA: hypothetical protein VJS20_07740 [Gemmatimonadales bacterium]|nr:hypothetical protein [Gemmatimonadales bacterium]